MKKHEEDGSIEFTEMTRWGNSGTREPTPQYILMRLKYIDDNVEYILYGSSVDDLDNVHYDKIEDPVSLLALFGSVLDPDDKEWNKIPE